jgi:hypothetical protein
MNVREELLKAARIFADAAEEYQADEEPDDSGEFCVILRDWLRDEANRHIHLGGLDSGYDDVSVWDHASMTPEIVAVQPSVRMARLILGPVDESEL